MELIGWSISSCGFLQSSESALWDPHRILHSGELSYNDCWPQVSWSSLNPISKNFLGNSRFIYQNLCSVFLNEPSILTEQSKKYKFIVIYVVANLVDLSEKNWLLYILLLLQELVKMAYIVEHILYLWQHNLF